MNFLSDRLSNHLLLIVAPRAARGPMLDAAARLALRGPLRVLDGGNSFDAYTVARALRQHVPTLAALEHIYLARAFTCYQMLTLLKETPLETLPTLVLDLLATFYDENVPLDECQRLLEDSLKYLRRLSLHGPVVVSARPPKIFQPERVPLLETLERAADQVYALEQPLPQLPPRLF